MKFLLEYRQYFKEGDIVVIEYWYCDILTPVKIIDRIKNTLIVSHNIDGSDLKNAPDEKIRVSDVIDYYSASSSSKRDSKSL
jgi:hypothetical protein